MSLKICKLILQMDLDKNQVLMVINFMTLQIEEVTSLTA